MKIVKKTLDLMILKDRNIIVFILGIIFTLMGFVMILKPHIFSERSPVWLGLFFFLSGGFVIFVAKITTIILDKTSNKLLFLRRNLLGKKIKEYNLDQIKEVELSVGYSSTNKNVSYSYHLSFVLNNGEIIPLNPGSNLSVIRISGIIGIGNKEIIPDKTLGAKIANFLGVPFQERRPPTVDEILSTVSSAIQDATEKEIEKQQERK